MPSRKISGLVQLAALILGPADFRRAVTEVDGAIHNMVKRRPLHMAAVSGP